MRLMTMKELNRVFSLRESRRVKARVRKKNRELPLAKAKGFFSEHHCPDFLLHRILRLAYH